MPTLAHSAAKKLVRDLDQDAAAVAHLGVGAHRAAMVEVVRGSTRPLLDDVVRLAVLHVGDEADAAGILLVARIVEALGRRQTWIAHERTSVSRRGRAARHFDFQALGRHARSWQSSHPNASSGSFEAAFGPAG